ncbi:MAG: beta-galactosidase trimerization domain-containing protein, partial [Kiritimatiellae bacterium]|nr:beta-galactosidase trimerization domain-containing protein [Kiritimatiellia bacterium]
AGHGNHNFAKSAAEAMMEAHLPLAAVFEAQLPEGRLDRYRFLVASGIDATRDGTVAALRSWVERGGTLVLGQEAMTLDEWARERPAAATFGIALGDQVKGAPQPFKLGGVEYEGAPYRAVSGRSDGWEVAAVFADGAPAVLKRRIGKGTVYFNAARMDAAGEARLLAALAFEAGIAPVAHALDFETGADVPNLEIHAARCDGGRAFALILHGLVPRAVRFIPGPGFKCDDLVNVADGTLLGRDADGAALLLMEPDKPVLLRGARDGAGCRQAREGLLGRLFGRNRAASPADGTLAAMVVSSEPYGDVAAKARQWLDERRPKPAGKAFSVDLSRMRFVDLRAAANRSFVDSVAGDGKGGWTDQGENCLRNAPWGVTDCNGVPFDFIRPDQNEERACIVLKSAHLPDLPDAVRGIEVGARVEALWFLHAGAWLEAMTDEAFSYVVHYADGTTETAPMMPKTDFDDWWVRSRGKPPATARCRVGWTNSEKKGFYVLRWENPHPEKTVATIDVESAGTNVAPLVAAITAEIPDDSPTALWRLKARSWNGTGAVRRHCGLELLCGDETKDWAGTHLEFPEPVALPEVHEGSQLALAFEVDGGENALGARDCPPPAFQVAVTLVDGEGAKRRTAYVTGKPEGGSTDADPDTWQRVEIPLGRQLEGGEKAATGVSVQFKAMPARRAGLVIRNLRFVEIPSRPAQ